MAVSQCGWYPLYLRGVCCTRVCLWQAGGRRWSGTYVWMVSQHGKGVELLGRQQRLQSVGGIYSARVPVYDVTVSALGLCYGERSDGRLVRFALCFASTEGHPPSRLTFRVLEDSEGHHG